MDASSTGHRTADQIHLIGPVSEVDAVASVKPELDQTISRNLMQRHPMTPEGHKQLTVTVKHLKEVVRPQIVKDIEEARAHGDLSENSEYEDAKERQSLTEGRVRDLEAKLAAAEIIDITKMEPSDRVVFGVTVLVEDLTTEEESEYRIVGEDEADVKQGLISVRSPIARALIGREVDDEVTVKAPSGDRKLVITEVLYK